MYRCSIHARGHVCQCLHCCRSPPFPAVPGKLELHAPQHGYKNRMPRYSPYLIAQVSKVQGARCSTVTALYNIAEVGFTPALGPAQVLEVVEEEFPLHQQATGEDKREFTLAPPWSQQLAMSLLRAQHQKYPPHVQAS